MPQFHEKGLAKVDSRRRVSLARFAVDVKEGDQFFIEQSDEGEIRLVPATTLSLNELSVLQNPKRMAAMRRSARDIKAGRTKHMSFAQYLDEEVDEDDDEVQPKPKKRQAKASRAR